MMNETVDSSGLWVDAPCIEGSDMYAQPSAYPDQSAAEALLANGDGAPGRTNQHAQHRFGNCM
jgi:hypothetical protein